MNLLWLLLLIVPLPVKLYWDYNSWKTGYHINHPYRYALMGLFMLLISFIVWRFSPARYFVQPLFLSFAIFFMFFDYVINWVEHRDYWFIPDKEDTEASWTDRKIYAELGVWKLLLARIVFLALALTFNHWIF